MAFEAFRADLRACLERDPAARSALEVILLYPGFHALQFYRLSHFLWDARLRLMARFVSQLARFLTGIEIHPGARVGRGVFIDHGMGVVIGETGEVGNDVTLYHGVTLGGIAPSIDSAAQVNVKRHPTLRDRVIVGSGAQILGPITVGEDARVGSNAVVLRDVEPGQTMVGIPARPLTRRESPAEGFTPYGTQSTADPTLRTIEQLSEAVARLSHRVEELERERDQPPKPMRSIAGGG